MSETSSNQALASCQLELPTFVPQWDVLWQIPGLSAVAKNLLAFIGDRLKVERRKESDLRLVKISYNKIHEHFGGSYSISTLKRAVAQLVAHGWLELESKNGQKLHVYLTEKWPDPKRGLIHLNRCQNETGLDRRPVPKRNRTSAKLNPDQCQNGTPVGLIAEQSAGNVSPDDDLPLPEEPPDEAEINCHDDREVDLTGCPEPVEWKPPLRDGNTDMPPHYARMSR